MIVKILYNEKKTGYLKEYENLINPIFTVGEAVTQVIGNLKRDRKDYTIQKIEITTDNEYKKI